MPKMDLNSLSDQEILALLGMTLRELRISKDVSQKELAQQCGLSVFSITQTEHGHNISVLNFIKALRALGSLHMIENLVAPEIDRHISRRHASFHHLDHNSERES